MKTLEAFAAGSVVLVRDEEWLVRRSQATPQDGTLVECVGVSRLVRGHEASFFTALDTIKPLIPEEVTLKVDNSSEFVHTRLFLDSLIRRTPIPAGSSSLIAADDHLLERLEYQRRPVAKALESLQARLLIADAVGLGKTLEVGLLLSELIRRNRGERILVVTPKHILEQFQHELWTRFSIPLVRLDSTGIQRIRQQIPSNRNPFTVFPRAIISIDTLKSPGQYRHHLEDISWDAVVIDECHNVVGGHSLRGQLAKTLAPKTDSLILTSATPHNGKAESFANLISLLDPTAIADKHNYTANEIEDLYVRRHKSHSQVAAEVGNDWAERKPPIFIGCTASEAEEAVFAELTDVWLHPESGSPPYSGKGRSLFPWMLLKSFLSSHKALIQTITNRRKNIAKECEENPAEASRFEAEDAALARLLDLANQIDDNEAAKFAKLVEELKEIGIGPKSKQRVVIFSERVATIEWLTQALPKALKLKDKNISALYGQLSDNEQQDIIEEFGLADSDVRILIAGDMASEGVNLHKQCNHLVHWDLPWSLITIEQRNGRIDRYGQRNSPENRTLMLTPSDSRLEGELRVLRSLLDKEHQAHKSLGDAAALMGKYSSKEEEDELIKGLSAGKSVGEIIPEPEANDDFDFFSLGGLDLANKHVEVEKTLSLFDSTHSFVENALQHGLDSTVRDMLNLDDEKSKDFIALDPPEDLKRLFRFLPKSYLVEQKVNERLKLTSSKASAEMALERARNNSDSMWPEVGYLSSAHPLVNWLTDKVLASYGRNEAAVVRANVSSPVWLVQGLLSNALGGVQHVEWMAIEANAQGKLAVSDMESALKSSGFLDGMSNPGGQLGTNLLSALEASRGDVVTAARQHMLDVQSSVDSKVLERLDFAERKVQDWAKRSLELAEDSKSAADKARRVRTVEQEVKRAGSLRDSLMSSGDSVVRVIGVLVPA